MHVYCVGMAGPSASLDDNASIMDTDNAGEDRLVAREAREDGAAARGFEAFGYQPLWVRLACIGLDFLTQTYDQIRIVPEIALFEQYVCRAYYAQDTGPHYISDGLLLPPELCRVPDVQYQLARLRSWKALFDGMASTHMSTFLSPWFSY